ncbi:MAG TPA: 23S rRNA (guanosine(2251)-2'-O)-methyltransferase RlmB, partial [Bacteroidota bacterium]|nr:23S rRNA (guanosine(2251)-2'-O)-methyltransferase RlmB [Bacteroidota bacterium]
MQGIIAGRKPVMEALRAGTGIEKIVFLLGVQGTVIEEIRKTAERSKVPVTQANRQQFRELASDATTQGVVAVLHRGKSFVGIDEIIAAAAAKGEQPLVLILDGVEDPQNLGALVRSAECAGVHGVVLPKHHAATVTSAVVKASAGATEHMPMAEVTNVANTLDELKEKRFWTVGVAVEGETLYTAFDYTTPVAIVVGNEGKGIRRLVREHCDALVRIPMYGSLGSLNASGRRARDVRGRPP